MAQDYETQVKKWNVFEVSIKGPSTGNPFVEQNMTGIFTGKEESVRVNGFYDGDGIYRIRFMPSYQGKYNFVLRASFLNETLSGTFFVTAEEENHHGAVGKSGQYHFAYQDGTPFAPYGTTAYVWHLMDDETIEDTLTTLKNSPFNKLRFCVFPKHYVYNFTDPKCFPYEGTPMDCTKLNEDNFMKYIGKAEGNDFDYTRLNPSYFQALDEKIKRLSAIGVEAELILFHPYDRWGFSTMSDEENKLYLNYMINRYSAFHNVWWALANEWDLLPQISQQAWNTYGEMLLKNDPYHHLRSIHNCRQMFDHTRNWITHVSYQRINLYQGAEYVDGLRETYQKPVVCDEIGYEGNLAHGWGSLTAEELIRRYWETAIRGGYPCHGETLLNESGKLWWSHGGKLYGEAEARIAFMKEVLRGTEDSGLVRIPSSWDDVAAGKENEWMTESKSLILIYLSFMRPSFRDVFIDETTDYVVEVIDTWNMTIEKRGIFHGAFRVTLPSRQYMLIRLRKAFEEDYDLLEDITETSEVAAEKTSAAVKTVAEDEYMTAETVMEETPEIVPIVQEESPAYTEEETVVMPSFQQDDEIPEIIDDDAVEYETVEALDEINDLVAMPIEDDMKVDEDTLNIPPVDFSRSINDDPKEL